MPDSLDDLDLDLGRLPDPRPASDAAATPAQQIRRSLRGKHVCPFCGTQRDTDVGQCPQCNLEDTPTTRSATRTKLGPWYVLQGRNPSAPGMNFATLLVLIQKHRLTAKSVLRGPTTGQFWRHAVKVKGVSREFGLCWNCGGDVAKNARACPNCKRLQEPPINPDILLEPADYSVEDVTEAMWADAPDPSRQPRNSSVRDLAGRGGVRREIRTHNMPMAGTLPPRPVRGALADAAQELPPTGLEMAVFQMPAHPEAIRRSSAQPAKKVFKTLFVATLIGGAGFSIMCYFDPGLRRRTLELWQEAKAHIAPASTQPAGFQVDQEPVRPVRSPAPAPSPADQAKQKVWQLWRQGQEAEQKSNYAAAVAAWQSIKTLNVDPEEWPVGLEARIESAKKLAGTK